jgi:hypothetical protein
MTAFIHRRNQIKHQKVNDAEFKRLKIFAEKDLFDRKICPDN